MDAPLKKILRALSLELRHTLEGSYTEDGTWNAGDLERRLNQIGIWRDRPVKPISEMPNLSSVDRKARELIDAYLALRSDAGVSQSDAVAEFIRESAYSWANRLFALRCMEARGIIDPVILQEEVYHGRSMVHDRFAQTNPKQCTDEDDGLFAMLSEEFQERSQELPDLFAPDSPAVALRPSVVALKYCIALLSGSAPANGGRATDEVFTAPDAFGWAYQYWNSEEKDRIFDWVRSNRWAKLEGPDIIPVTQLYTEPYMVKFLVQNSLGTIWMGMHSDSQLGKSWEYYIKNPDQAPNENKIVTELTFLDPACGSGHFLIEAFDLLYAMYEEEGEIREPEAICQSILNNNLFGIDIDERAVQITKAVLWMKAAEMVFTKTKKPLTGEGLSEYHDHIIATNIRLPKGKDHLDAFLSKYPEDIPLRPALLTVFEGLQNVHEIGSLVQIEEPVEKELKVLKEQAKQQRFDSQSGEVVERVNFPRWKQQVMKRLKTHFQNEAQKALPTEVFFSQSAVKGLALFDLLARRYDVVAANPPYMHCSSFGNAMKEYIYCNYPKSSQDLYTVFIERCLKLSQKEGLVALVSQQSFMYLERHLNLRNHLYNETDPYLFIHLGPYAFSEITGIIVNVILLILHRSSKGRKGLFVDLTAEMKKETSLRLFCLTNGKSHFFTSERSWADFLRVPGHPIVYRLHISELNEFSCVKLENIADLPAGMVTGNNARFVKNWWEIRSGFNPYMNGGRSIPWYGNNDFSIDVSEKGMLRMRSSRTFRSAGIHLWGKPGITYSSVSTRLRARYMEAGSIWDCTGPVIIPHNSHDLFWILAFVNSAYAVQMIYAINPTISIKTNDLKRLPLCKKDIVAKLSLLASCSVEIAKRMDAAVPISRLFVAESLTNCNSLQIYVKNKIIESYTFSLYLSVFQEIIDESVFKGTGIDPSLKNKYMRDFHSFSLLKNNSSLPPITNEFLQWGKLGFADIFSNFSNVTSSENDIQAISNKLSIIYQKNSISIEVDDNQLIDGCPTDDKNENIGPIISGISQQPETSIEQFSKELKHHPISIYWLLKKGIEKEGWRCIPEEKHYIEDLFTVMVLRLLGHRWPKQIETNASVPEWVDADGIMPITSGLIHPTLLQQVRDRIAAEFPGGKVHEIEKEFEEVVGIPLERWLAGEFFKHHISQFKKRPIAWQLSSNPSGTGAGKGKGRGSRREPAFSCLVYYHKIDSDILHKIRTHYVGDLINRYGTELRALEVRKELTGDQASRKVQLDNWIAELKDFAQVLQDVADTGFDSAALREIVKTGPLDKWTSRDGKSPQPKTGDEFYAQEKRYDPDINDGVRVNISPLQKAGLLAAEVIAKKDVEKAIADRAEWRADERRWCREGKLPKCGWWE